VKMDFGVIRQAGGSDSLVCEYEEKPELLLTVSMGVYVMEPKVVQLVPAGEYFDFPDLVKTLLAEGLPVGTYPYDGLWFDIGRREDYEQAVTVWQELESAAVPA
jgi:NDP-sugar pyrophosphorylase family protein